MGGKVLYYRQRKPSRKKRENNLFPTKRAIEKEQYHGNGRAEAVRRTR
jgi:hypothetical protein